MTESDALPFRDVRVETAHGTVSYTDFDGDEHFTPPEMVRSSGGPIFTPSVPHLSYRAGRVSHDDSGTESLDLIPAELFWTEAEAMSYWEMTAEGLRSLFGPPIPAGAVWSEPVWSAAHMEHIVSEFVRPLLAKVAFDPNRSVKENFYSLKGEEPPLTDEETRQRERAAERQRRAEENQ